MEINFTKIICFSIEPLETVILEDANRAGIDEACQYVKEHPHPSPAIWVMIPMDVNI